MLTAMRPRLVECCRRPSAIIKVVDLLRKEREIVAEDLQPGCVVYRRIGGQEPLNSLPHSLIMVSAGAIIPH